MAWDERLLNGTVGPWHGARPPANSMEVTEIFPGSIAEAAGIRPGMLYLIDERDKAAQEWSAITARGATGRLISRFIDPVAGTMCTIETAGFPWGMRLEQPNHRLVEEVLGSYVNPTRLAAPLLYGSETAFADLANAALARAKRPSFKQLLVKAALNLFGRGADLEPVIKFQRAIAAIAAARLGDARTARRLMPPLDVGLLHNYGTAAGASCLLAEAMVAEVERQPQAQILEPLRHAFQLEPTSQRLADMLTRHGEPMVAKGTHTIARPLGIDYNLPVADALEAPIRHADLAAGPHVRLSDCLASLRADQLGVVIMLGGYRVNGPYSKVIENLGYLYDLVGSRLPFMHVVSSLEAVTNPANVELWKPGETTARSLGLPITVLHDSDNAIQDALSITTSPVVYLLTRESTVLYQGSDADDGPFWQAFERLDGMRRSVGH